MMMKMMMKLGFLPLILVATSHAAAPGSCVGRCGEAFTRGQPCTCDSSCMQYNECCPDFEASCTAVRSCQGRCDEVFRRGRPCDCDRQCGLLNTCCHDYQLQCDVPDSHNRRPQPVVIKISRNRKTETSQETSNSESEESHSVQSHCPQCRGAQRQSTFGQFKPRIVGSSGPSSPANPLQHGGGNIPAARLPSLFSPQGTPPHDPAPIPSQPSLSASALGSSTQNNSSGPGGADGGRKVQMLLYPGRFHPSGSGQVSGSFGSRPSSLQDMLQTLGLSVVQEDPEASDLSSGMDLCRDAFINGLTALNNGTILIFKGDLFWSVEPVSHSVGNPRRITEILGIPSPIDTAFTRTDCNRNTYIIKEDQYWQFDGNMVMKPGFPKPLTSEFPGLTGRISAALAVPATSSRPETVFFFKKGDIMLKFTFPSCSTPSLREGPRNSLKKNFARQADALLSGEINIRVSLKAFPTPVTAALSMHTPQGSDRYQHFIFSGPLFFKVHIIDDLPAIAKPDPAETPTPLLLRPAAMATNPATTAGQSLNSPHPVNSIRFWLHCP